MRACHSLGRPASRSATIDDTWFDDRETMRILDDVIVLAVHANPDGHDLYADWYMSNDDPLELAFLLAHDTDPFHRWDAGQSLAQEICLELAADAAAGRELRLDPAFADAVEGGVTTIVTGPGSGENVSGMAMVVKTFVGGALFLLGLPPIVLQVLLVAVHFLAISAFVWAAYRMVDIVSAVLTLRAERTRAP